MRSRWTGLVVGLSLVLVANIGAVWFGKSFKIGLAVLVFSVFVVVWMLVRHRKAQLVRDLMGEDAETQDKILAGLDEDDRREILKRLGRENG